jgi:Mn2+/Fe2+ NRAMP family transporter
VAFNFAKIDPMRALLWSAVINGLISAPVLVLMMLVAREPAIMGRLVLPPRLIVLGWITAAIMLAMAVGLVATLGR